MSEAILASMNGADEWIALSRRTRGQKGKLFDKHILSLGTLIVPGSKKKIEITEEFARRMISNFDSGICDIVQVPLADDQNRHVEDPNRNIGEVVGLSLRGKKIIATIDVRDENAADKIGKTLLGTSAYIHTDYTDTSTGEKVGPTLVHACVTNHPYLSGLDDYEEIIAATAADSETAPEILVMTNAEVAMPTKEELIAALKQDHGIDVEALQAQAESSVDVAALTSQFVEALRPAASTSTDTLALSNANISLDDVVGAVKEIAEQHIALSTKNTELTDTVAKLSRKAAEAEVASKVEQGFIMPKQAQVMTDLFLTNRTAYDALLPETPILKMSSERGSDPAVQGQEHVDARKADVDRYVKMIDC